jgi:hypothetical protein
VTEQDVRDGLHGAVADEPPLHLDPDALVATARREARRRRALVSVGAATTAIAVAAVAVPVALGISHATVPVATRPPATRPPATSAAPSPADIPWPPRGVEPKYYSAKQLGQRGTAMRAHLTQAFPAAVPGASAVAVQAFQGEAAGEVSDGQNYLNSFVVFTMAARRYAVGVSVFTPGAFIQRPADLCADPGRCSLLDGRGRGELLAVEEPLGDASPGMRIVSVYQFRPDGSVTYASGYNYDPTGTGKPAPAADLPVTVNQLATLAADPAIGL